MTKEVAYGSWRVMESPVAIEYSMPVLEEIRQAVIAGFHRLSRGGVEVGGLLFGARQGRTVRVLAQQPIACEHAHGPAFVLSPQEEAALKAQIDQAQNDPRLAGLSCVGWYVSHTRSGIALTDSDLHIYKTFFSAPWQITFVLRPGRHGGVRGGFFVWESDGSVVSDRSYEEFNLPMPASPAAVSEAAERAPAAVFPRGEITPLQRFEPPKLILDEVQPKSRWPLLLLLAMLATASVAGWRWFAMGDSPVPLALQVFERDGQLQIEWNREGPLVKNARSGVLTIVDGSERRELPLSPAELAKGNVTYARTADDVEVRLRVEGPNQSSREEASRFLGRAVEQKTPAELEALRAERDELRGTLKRLQIDNDRQANRIKQLEEAIRILENRLQVTAR